MIHLNQREAGLWLSRNLAPGAAASVLAVRGRRTVALVARRDPGGAVAWRYCWPCLTPPDRIIEIAGQAAILLSNRVLPMRCSPFRELLHG